MTTAIQMLLAAEHVADLRRGAENRRLVTRDYDEAPGRAIELRLVTADESDAGRRLAALDDAPELEGEVLLALIDGTAVAGLSLIDRRVVADPFVATSDAVALLRLRAEHLSGTRPGRQRLRRILRPRPA